MEITGKLSHVLEAKSGVSAKTGKNWTSQDFVIEFVNGQYVNHFTFSVFGEEKLKNFADLLVVGKDIKVTFDVDAREYNGRWYNSVTAWKIEDVASTEAGIPQPAANGASAAAVAQPIPAPSAAAIPAPQADSNGDELPF